MKQSSYSVRDKARPAGEITSQVDGTAPSEKLSFIDLFCGCGGFTLGMTRAGFDCVAAVDLDENAVATLQRNLPDLPHVLERDLIKYAPDELAKLIGRKHVDVIVGGPPCQGFSTARQVDGANHGDRLKDDPRRKLYREFLKYVDYFQPRVFVMENVLGMRKAADGEYFTRVQHEARNLGKSRGLPGYRVHAQVEDAVALGVPQKRRRQLIVGVRADLPAYFIPELAPAPSADLKVTLGDAIGDLPILRAGGGDNEREYNPKRRSDHLRSASEAARKYLFEVLEVDRASKLTGHVARPHSDRDLRDFSRLKEGESSAVAMRDRGVKFEFPYDKSCFKDRYTRQSRRAPCSTIVAHLSKDGLMFIHPTQNRSLTPREAARIQSFPDWFTFPESRTKAFRLIGNAVPPLVGEAVGIAVNRFLTESLTALKNASEARSTASSSAGRPGNGHKTTRRDEPQSLLAETVTRLAALDRQKLRAVTKRNFLQGWQALLTLFPELHPDNALDHGDREQFCPEIALMFPDLANSERRRYLRSGWPIAFEMIGHEAWRRSTEGKLSQAELYVSPDGSRMIPARARASS